MAVKSLPGGTFAGGGRRTRPMDPRRKWPQVGYIRTLEAVYGEAGQG